MIFLKQLNLNNEHCSAEKSEVRPADTLYKPGAGNLNFFFVVIELGKWQHRSTTRSRRLRRSAVVVEKGARRGAKRVETVEKESGI